MSHPWKCLRPSWKEQQHSLGLLVDGCDVSTGHLPCVVDVLKKVFFHKVGDNNLILANLQIEGCKGSRSLPYLICLLENNLGLQKDKKFTKVNLLTRQLCGCFGFLLILNCASVFFFCFPPQLLWLLLPFACLHSPPVASSLACISCWPVPAALVTDR